MNCSNSIIFIFVIVIIDSINQLAVQLRRKHTFTYKNCNLMPKFHHTYYLIIQINWYECFFFFVFFFSPVELSFQSQSTYFSRGYWATTILNHHEINFPWNSIIDSHHFNSTEQYQTFGLNFEILYLKREGSLTKWENITVITTTKLKDLSFCKICSPSPISFCKDCSVSLIRPFKYAKKEAERK